MPRSVTQIQIRDAVGEVEAGPPGGAIGAFFDLSPGLLDGLQPVLDAHSASGHTVVRAVPSGDPEALIALAEEQGVDLGESFLYADRDEDEALMHLVRHRRPVNPHPGLSSLARRRGWPVLRVASRAPPARVQRLRNALGIASLLPAAGTGVAVGLLRWNRRAGLNVTGAAWLDSMLRLNGVSVRVVRGQEHLHAPRPALFIFNHKNNFDPLIVASLVRRDFTAVAKMEAAADPIMAILGRVANLVFLDRSNPRVALEQLRQVEDLARGGLSIIIAPEGTRSPDGELGPFKKGAFRVAIATGLPIVPVVVRNAEVIGDRDARVMREGTVEVAVLPPVTADGWTSGTVSAHIEAIRRQFADTLRRWPGQPGA